MKAVLRWEFGGEIENPIVDYNEVAAEVIAMVGAAELGK